jgi:hypothetical protein
MYRDNNESVRMQLVTGEMERVMQPLYSFSGIYSIRNSSRRRKWSFSTITMKSFVEISREMIVVLLRYCGGGMAPSDPTRWQRNGAKVLLEDRW